MKQTPEIIRVRPQFPNFEQENGVIRFFKFLSGILLWIFLLIAFLVGLYANLFSKSLTYLLEHIYPKRYDVPFWFALLMTIFLFPMTILVILFVSFIKIIKR